MAEPALGMVGAGHLLQAKFSWGLTIIVSFCPALARWFPDAIGIMFNRCVKYLSRAP